MQTYINKQNIKLKIINFIIAFLTSSIVAIILPRSIGVEEYGKLGYIVATSNFFLTIFALGSTASMPYFIFKNYKGILEFYQRYYLLVIALTISIIIFSFINSVGYINFWSGYNAILITLGTISVSLIFFESRIVDIADCCGETKRIDKLKLLIKICSVATLICLYLINRISLELYFSVCIIYSLIFIIFSKKNINMKYGDYENKNKITENNLIYEFYKFNKSYMYIVLISSLYQYLSRFIVEHKSQVGEMGFFTLAYSLSSVLIMSFNSISMLIQCWISEKIKEEEVINVYNKIMSNIFRVLLIFTPIIIIIIYFSSEIIVIITNESFGKASESFVWLMLFAILQIPGTILVSFYNICNIPEILNKINGVVFGVSIIFYLYIYFYTDEVTSLFVCKFIFWGYLIRLIFLHVNFKNLFARNDKCTLNT